MIITSTEKYLTIGATSFNKRRIKSIRKDNEIILIDATGRQDPESAPNNVIDINYRHITAPVFASAEDLKAYLIRKSRPVENPVISNIAFSNLTEVGARITATIDNKNSDTVVTVEYGTTAAYGQVSDPVTISELGTATIDIAGLLVYTAYFFRLKAVNSKGTTYLAGANFTTAYPAEFDAYLTRVTADAGIVRSNEFTKSYIAFLKNQGRYNDVKVLIAPETGSKRRVSGINTYISKLHSPQLAANDAGQVTELNQPFKAGNVAPNERYAVLNPNGSVRFLTHSPIIYEHNQPFTVNFLCNFNNDSSNGFLKFNSSGLGGIWLQKMANNSFRFYSATNIGDFTGPLFTCSFVGKNVLLTFMCDGDGTYNVFLNGTLVNTFNKAVGARPTFTFNQLFNNSPSYFPYGKIYTYLVQSGTLTAPQITAEYNLLRSWLPEISNVTIGAQQWATSNLDIVCTPQGNLIKEVQLNSNTEKLVGGNFEGGLIGIKWDEYGSVSSWALNNINPISGAQDGKLVISNSYNNRPFLRWTDGVGITSEKWYKYSFNYKVNSGTAIIQSVYDGAGSIVYGEALAGSGVFTKYIKCAVNSGFCNTYFGNSVCDIQLDNISIQEVGWANSQELYDAIYAQTGGTVEQKTYAAVKAAAMWSYYNNDPAQGSVYGKLYNWFAAKLLQMDIDYYNAANPTTLWGWKVPANIDFITLQTTLGGLNIAGSKMKVAGNIHWNILNANSNNESGFTGLGAGGRSYTTGNFDQINARERFISTDEKYSALESETSNFIVGGTLPKGFGTSIRLLKS